MENISQSEPSRSTDSLNSTFTNATAVSSRSKAGTPAKGKAKKHSSLLSFDATKANASSSSLRTIATTSTLWHGSERKRLRPAKSIISKGIEYISIRYRLTVISNHFPHTDADGAPNIHRVYDDILELLGHDSCPAEAKQRVLLLVIDQIGRRHIRHLLQSFERQPIFVMQDFFSELFVEMASLWSRSFQVTSRQTEIYHRDRFLGMEKHSAMPFVDFIYQVVLIGSSVCQAVLQAGLLDVLLYMYVCDFLDPLQKFPTFWKREPLLFACTSILRYLCNYQEFLEVISNHPLHILWPHCEEFSPKKDSQSAAIRERWRTWEPLDRNLLDIRLHTIYLVLPFTSGTRSADDGLGFQATSLLNACMDLLQLMRLGAQGFPNTSILRLWQVFGKCLADDAYLAEVLSAHLARCPVNEIHDTFCRLLPLLSRILVTFFDMPDWEHGLLSFVIAVAEHRPVSRRAILDAGFASVALLMLKVDLRYAMQTDRRLVQLDLFSDTVIFPNNHVIVSKILDIIDAQGLEALLRDEDGLVGRRLLICRAFNNLLIPLKEILTMLRELLGEPGVRQALVRVHRKIRSDIECIPTSGL